jgi:Zn-dependent peptidase ImmA (M78 family)
MKVQYQMNEIPGFKKAETSALKILEDNFITSWPIPVEELIEFHGLGLIFSEFTDGEISGVIDLNKKYLYINSADSPQRQRFTIAHELGHWILHQPELNSNRDIAVLYRRPIGDDDDRLEQEANCFAANLLVPEILLRDALMYRKESANDISEDAYLAKIFNVSRSVIGYRRKFLRI